MNKEEMEAELIGALIGDGYISLASGKYIVGFVGHPIDDLEYHKYLSKLMQKVWDKVPRSVIRLGGLRTKFYSKEICYKLINDLGLLYGAGKAKNVFIPEMFVLNWKLLKYIIRGIVDTDGSVFYSKKPGVEKYPAIEITTISIKLAEQLRESLLCQSFRVTKLRSYGGQLSKHRKYKVGLYGQNNLMHWLKEIGFSNPTKQAKAIALCSDY
ncbi:MAG: hypothetical protein HOE11_01080 [Candidatus Diapherotrites archaeon]|nr:hypothetical protein [Candidatus Diapherotrites archaeon]MBT4596997.1 hypothetical protein [Candidatus Diapherotrites archaeon]